MCTAFESTPVNSGSRLRQEPYKLARINPDNREIDYGTQIFQEGFHRRQARNEEAQERYLEERSFGQEGQEPQAGGRDRPLRGARQGQEGAEESFEETEDDQEAEGEEEVGSLFS